MGSAKSRPRQPRVRLSNAITGATTEIPETRDVSVMRLPERIEFIPNAEPECQDLSKHPTAKAEQLSNKKVQNQSLPPRADSTLVNPVHLNSENDISQLLNEVLKNKRKRGLWEQYSQPEQEESKATGKIQRVQSQEIDNILRRIKTIRSIIQRDTPDLEGQVLKIPSAPLRSQISEQTEEANLDELESLLYSESSVILPSIQQV